MKRPNRSKPPRKAPPLKKVRQLIDLTVDKRALRRYILGMGKKLASPDRPAAVAYVRVSSREQAETGGSLEAQREAVLRHSVLCGLDLVDTFEDAGISGSKDETKRAGLASALAAIREGRASVLVVAHSDRLSRDSDYAGSIRHELKTIGARVEIIAEVKDDPIRCAVDKMLAELERIRASQRMKLFHAGRKSHGLSAGPSPYGFTKGSDGRLEPLPGETEVVERIKAEHASGAPLRTIAAGLARDSIATRTGASWSPALLSKILRRA